MLSYDVVPDRVVLVVDAVLSNRHPLAGPPKSGEVHRYEQIELSFEDVTGLRFAESSSVSARDATGEVDYGNIDHFDVGADGCYTLRGMTFGDLDFNARECRITVLSRSWEN